MPSSRSTAAIEAEKRQLTALHESEMRWLGSVNAGPKRTSMSEKAVKRYNASVSKLDTELSLAKPSVPTSRPQSSVSQSATQSTRTPGKIEQDEQTLADTRAFLYTEYTRERRALQLRGKSTIQIDETWEQVRAKTKGQKVALQRERETFDQAVEDTLNRPTLPSAFSYR